MENTSKNTPTKNANQNKKKSPPSQKNPQKKTNKSTLKVTIRQATVEDIDFLASNTAELAYETEQKICDLDHTKKFLLPGLKNPDATEFWIASTEDESQDIASLCITKEYNIPRASSCSWFQSVFVRKNFRGRKVFSQLFKNCRRRAEILDHFGMKLYVEANNKKAIQVYKHYDMYFPECQIYEADLIFSFNAKDFDVEKVEENYLKFKEFFSQKKISGFFGNEVNNDNFNLQWIRRGDEGRKIWEERYENKVNFEDFKPIINIKEVEMLDIEDMKKGFEFYLSENCKYSSFFILTKKNILNNEEIPIAILSTFEEFSDWRGGNIHWVYDLRFRDGYEEGFQDILVILNRKILEMMKIEDIKCFRWQVFGGDFEWVKEILTEMGYVKYGDDVMHLDF